MLRLWAAGLTGRYDPDLRAVTLVPTERLAREYHRRWHQTHGSFVARMPFRESRDRGQWVVKAARDGRLLFGAPLFECRSLLRHAAMWARHLAAGRADRAFSHELRARYSISFITTAVRLHLRERLRPPRSFWPTRGRKSGTVPQPH